MGEFNKRKILQQIEELKNVNLVINYIFRKLKVNIDASSIEEELLTTRKVAICFL